MGLLKDAAYVALGYGTVEYMNRKSKKRSNDATQNVDQREWLDDIIHDYARQHDIFGYNYRFYKQLMRIAEKYREY